MLNVRYFTHVFQQLSHMCPMVLIDEPFFIRNDGTNEDSRVHYLFFFCHPQRPGEECTVFNPRTTTPSSDPGFSTQITRKHFQRLGPETAV
jgi:hypothetical protein